MLIYSPPVTLDSVPVIDLKGGPGSDPAAYPNIAGQIREACRNIGFFYVSNHGVSHDLVSNQFEWARRFFALPMDEKMAIHMRKSPTTAGYEPIAEQQLDSQDLDAEKSPPDLKESYYCGLEVPDDHAFAKRHVRGIGHNQWPASIPGFRDQMIAYQTEMRKLSDHLLTLIALSLDLESNWFAGYHDWPGAVLRILRYPPQPETSEFN